MRKNPRDFARKVARVVFPVPGVPEIAIQYLGGDILVLLRQFAMLVMVLLPEAVNQMLVPEPVQQKDNPKESRGIAYQSKELSRYACKRHLENENFPDHFFGDDKRIQGYNLPHRRRQPFQRQKIGR